MFGACPCPSPIATPQLAPGPVLRPCRTHPTRHPSSSGARAPLWPGPMATSRPLAIHTHIGPGGLTRGPCPDRRPMPSKPAPARALMAIWAPWPWPWVCRPRGRAGASHHQWGAYRQPAQCTFLHQPRAPTHQHKAAAHRAGARHVRDTGTRPAQGRASGEARFRWCNAAI